MLKRIGISVATLCAAIVLAKPPVAAAAGRDDNNNRPSYQQSEGRNSYGGYQTAGGNQTAERYRNDQRGSTWQNSYGYGQRGSTWGDGGRGGDNRSNNDWRQRNRGNQHQSWNYRNRHNSYNR